MGKELVQQMSLQEMLDISDAMQQDEETNSNIGTEKLAVYVRDLIPNKVDNIARWIEREKQAIENEKAFIKSQKEQVERRERSLEKLKSYMAMVLDQNNITSTDRLNGNANAIWCGYTEAVRDDINLQSGIPDECIINTISVRGNVYKSIMKNLEGLPIIKQSAVVDKILLKEMVASGKITGNFIRINKHFKAGKSNVKPRETKDELQVQEPQKI